MKKQLISVLLICTLVCTGLSAATTKDVAFKTSLGASTGMDLNVTAPPNGGAVSTRFTVAIDADLAILFKNGLGPYIAFSPEFKVTSGTSSSFDLVLGIAYEVPLSKTIDLLLTAGPSVTFNSNKTLIGAQVMCNFDFVVTKSMFLRLGIGLDMDFAAFPQNGSSYAFFQMNMPIPSLSVGWNF